MRLSVASTSLLLTLFFPCAHAATSNDAMTAALAGDSAALAQLEDRAEHAAVREQCFLYTELVQVYADVAARQLAAGDSAKAGTTLQRVQHLAELIHQGLARDSKHLKDAEMMVHMASFRLGQMLRRVSDEDKPVTENTIKRLDKVHEELLTQVFAH